MNVQHVSANTIREFLRGELPKHEEKLIGLHLSFCLLCQTKREAALFDEVNLDLCGLANRSQKEITTHVESSVFVDFWKGRIKDTHRLEEISEHCLLCEFCRQKRYEVWRDNRSRVEAERHLAAVLGVLVVLARRTRRHAGIVAAVAALTLINATFLFLRGGDSLLGNSVSLSWPADEIPGIALPNFPRIPTIRNSPTDVIYVGQKPGRSDELAVVKQTATGVPTKVSVRHIAPVKAPERLWEQLAKVQRIHLTYPVDHEPFRGPDFQVEQDKHLWPVVISRTKSTGIHIQLPDDSKHGKYLISLRETEQVDTKLADDETVTADGKELAVQLDLTKVKPGEYVLLVERETDGSDEKELLGFFPVFLIAAAK